MVTDAHAQAAAAYVAYGLVYLASAWAAMTPERMQPTWGLPWWSFFVAGSVLLLVVPWLVMKRLRWFTFVLAMGPAVKALVLIHRQGARNGAGEPMPWHDWVFAAAAMVAAVMLVRAGLAARRHRQAMED